MRNAGADRGKGDGSQTPLIRDLEAAPRRPAQAVTDVPSGVLTDRRGSVPRADRGRWHNRRIPSTITGAMEPKPTVLERLDDAIWALETAFVRACHTFETLRGGGDSGPLFHPEDEGPIAP